MCKSTKNKGLRQAYQRTGKTCTSPAVCLFSLVRPRHPSHVAKPHPASRPFDTSCFCETTNSVLLLHPHGYPPLLLTQTLANLDLLHENENFATGRSPSRPNPGEGKKPAKKNSLTVAVAAVTMVSGMASVARRRQEVHLAGWRTDFVTARQLASKTNGCPRRRLGLGRGRQNG